MNKKWTALVLSAALTLSMTACGSASGSTAQSTAQSFAENTGAAAAEGTGTQETLTIALPAEPATLDPFQHSNQNGFICTSLVFEPLIKKTDDGELIPWLATEWEYIDDTTLHFTLRDDVTSRTAAR